ncbi:hypothetical protein [Anoxybacillus flavithermus]|uniref:hypothetical protein n=1 Tax=Anoxybacillus flavithermus TaxID=33934 RepID=UPI001FCC8FF6|nr:hypothetical protein [Anoxybacillus flavithermus]
MILQQIAKATHSVEQVSHEQKEEAKRIAEAFDEVSATMETFREGAQKQTAFVDEARQRIQTMLQYMHTVQSETNVTSVWRGIKRKGEPNVHWLARFLYDTYMPQCRSLKRQEVKTYPLLLN